MENLTHFIRQIGQKFGIYFLYICAQIFILASLLLTTTGITVHVIFMILTMIFYFVTALKNPGFYEGPVQPNHEDVNNSIPQIKISKQKSMQKRWHSQKECQISHHSSKKSNTSIKKQEQNVSIEKQQNVEKDQKKPSISKILVQTQQKTAFEAIQEVKKQKVDSKKEIKADILNIAKGIFLHLGIFRSKKDLFQKEVPEQIANDGIQYKDLQVQPKEQSPKIQLQVPAQTNQPKLSKVSDKQQGVNSMIGKEDFGQLQIHSNLIPDVKIPKQTKKIQAETIFEKMNQTKRYCRICETYQPLRVRHCHTCDRCVATFDHHCPWMANCIGEKNKIYFIVYLLLQTLQLFTIVVDLIHFLSGNVADNSTSVGILLMAVILIFALIVILVCFHSYLIAKNLTTWQLLRWDRIQYLRIFDKSKISSPFNKGICKNFKFFWKYSTQPILEDWKKQLNQDLCHYLIQTKRQSKSQIDPVDSDRRPFKSQRLVRT